jgi:hypothetical protein
MPRSGIGRKPPKPKIELMLLPEERCVLVRRGKRIYQLKVSDDGSHLHVVGEPPKKMARRLEKHLRAIATTLKVRKKFVRRCVTHWAKQVGVFREIEFEIPQGRK